MVNLKRIMEGKNYNNSSVKDYDDLEDLENQSEEVKTLNKKNAPKLTGADLVDKDLKTNSLDELFDMEKEEVADEHFLNDLINMGANNRFANDISQMLKKQATAIAINEKEIKTLINTLFGDKPIGQTIIEATLTHAAACESKIINDVEAGMAPDDEMSICIIEPVNLPQKTIKQVQLPPEVATELKLAGSRLTNCVQIENGRLVNQPIMIYLYKKADDHKLLEPIVPELFNNHISIPLLSLLIVLRYYLNLPVNEIIAILAKEQLVLSKEQISLMLSQAYKLYIKDLVTDLKNDLLKEKIIHVSENVIKFKDGDRYCYLYKTGLNSQKEIVYVDIKPGQTAFLSEFDNYLVCEADKFTATNCTKIYCFSTAVLNYYNVAYPKLQDNAQFNEILNLCSQIKNIELATFFLPADERLMLRNSEIKPLIAQLKKLLSDNKDINDKAIEEASDGLVKALNSFKYLYLDANIVADNATIKRLKLYPIIYSPFYQLSASCNYVDISTSFYSLLFTAAENHSCIYRYLIDLLSAYRPKNIENNIMMFCQDLVA